MEELTQEEIVKLKKIASLYEEGGRKNFHEPVEKEERYWKIQESFSPIYEVGKIYPSIERIRFSEQVSKSDYDKQELLEEAKRRGYVKGVRYISAYLSAHEAIIKEDIKYYEHSVGVQLTDGCGGSIYFNGKWAEIIPQKEEPKKEPLFTFEDFKKDLINLLDKYSCGL